MDLNTKDEGRRPASEKARYIMIGGFLGAGKTTSVARLAQHLTDQGLRVGLITNDQGSGLVDTAMLASRGFATEEIAGGCFCCRFNSLLDAAGNLSKQTRPDVFIAEPVGSCTDLVATVTYPLRRIYGEDFLVAPLSVVVDPVRASRVLGLTEGGGFSEKVRYIYNKQLEEADVIVINKCDLLGVEELSRLRASLGERFPGARRFEVSARSGEGLAPWFAHVTAIEQRARGVMEVDYDLYAEGEALLGWLNATAQLSSDRDFDGNALLEALAAALQAGLSAEGGEVAHLKATLSPDEGLGDLGVINLVRNDHVPELSQELGEAMGGGQLIINIRAEQEPGVMRAALTGALKVLGGIFPGLRVDLEHVEQFKPGRPVPIHRDKG